MIYNEVNNNKDKWMVLLHCVCGNERIFDKQMRLLNKYYNIAIIRLAGHDIHSSRDEATFDYVVEEIHNFAIKKGIKIDVIGVSMGAMIATDYMTKYPDDVENAYLIGNIYGFSIPLFKAGYMLLLKVNKILPRSVYMYIITKLILPGKNQRYQRKKLYATSRRINKYFLYAWMNEMGKFIMHGNEKLKLTMNSQINVRHIYGAKDGIFLGWFKRRIKNSKNIKLHIIENAGHLCNIEQSDDVNIIIEEDNCEDFSNN